MFVLANELLDPLNRCNTAVISTLDRNYEIPLSELSFDQHIDLTKSARNRIPKFW